MQIQNFHTFFQRQSEKCLAPSVHRVVILALTGIMRQHQDGESCLVGKIGVIMVGSAVMIFLTEDAHLIDHLGKNH